MATGKGLGTRLCCVQPYALIHVRRPREHARRLPGDIGQPDEEPAGKASRAGTAPLAKQGAGLRHRTPRASNRRPPSEPRPAENARRGSAACKRPPATLPAWQVGIGDASRASPNAKGRLAPEGAGGQSAFAGSRKRPQTKEDPYGSPSPRCPVRACPPLARATRPGGRRRPSLPQGRPCSTFGAGRLNFRVRYGSGCAPAAVAAGPRGALRRGLRRGGSAPKLSLIHI